MADDSTDEIGLSQLLAGLGQAPKNPGLQAPDLSALGPGIAAIQAGNNYNQYQKDKTSQAQAASAFQQDLPSIIDAAHKGDYRSAFAGLAKHNPSILTPAISKAFGLAAQTDIAPKTDTVTGANDTYLVPTQGINTGKAKALGVGIKPDQKSGQQDRIDARAKQQALMNKQKEYNSNAKAIKEAARYAKQALNVINDPDASKMMGAIQFLTARASGSNSQLSDAESKAVSGLQDLMSQANQLTSSNLRSEFTKENKQVFKSLLTQYLKAADTAQDEIGDRMAEQLGSTDYFADENVPSVRDRIIGRASRREGPAPKKEEAKSLSSPYTSDQEQGIQRVMQSNPKASREQVIQGLKQAGKLK